MKDPKLVIVLACFTAGSSLLLGQGAAEQPRNNGPRVPEGGRRPRPPIIAALDLNHDGIISADEIAKAPESLKRLDKNGDGQLTPDELRPPRPPRAQDQAPPP